ncbi:TlpA family protein disulfide reductase [Paenibacillus sp. 481]|uniref:TlpA family protein disulfide reductase n=1 Tax=Paenibacillus sp. 481 TaxID=2835869 RepID=UPI001E29DA73|nr:TlpA disulfide reductase family protein [Paenibacillus sp. 481]UHA72613.1 TlpA family protein disulfide reductase [Paenibacillus sp. 481]
MRKSWLILAISMILIGMAWSKNVLFSDSKPLREASGTVTLPTETGPRVGMLAPAFSLTSLTGETFEVGGKRDKPVFINFWASWCNPCRAEAPDLVKLYAKYQNELDMYAINVTAHDTKEKAGAFVKEYNLINPVLWDEKGDVFKSYNGIAFPTNIIIDRNGVVSEVIVGLRPAKDLEKSIRKVIK